MALGWPPRVGSADRRVCNEYRCLFLLEVICVQERMFCPLWEIRSLGHQREKQIENHLLFPVMFWFLFTSISLTCWCVLMREKKIMSLILEIQIIIITKQENVDSQNNNNKNNIFKFVHVSYMERSKQNFKSYLWQYCFPGESIHNCQPFCSWIITSRYTNIRVRTDLQLESRLPGEISVTSDMQMTPPLWQKVKRN